MGTQSKLPIEKAIGTALLLKKVAQRISADELMDVSARIAFYLFFSVFPLVIVATSMMQLMHLDYHPLLKYAYSMLPQGMGPAIQSALENVLSKQQGGALSIGLLLTLWAASSGIVALLDGVNTALETKTEQRSFIRERALAIALSIVLLAVSGIGLSLVVWGGPVDTWFFRTFHPGHTVTLLWHVVRYAVTFVLMVLMCQILYYAAPVKHPKFEWLTAGSITAVICWFVLTLLFGMYLKHFGSSYASYGPVGSVMAFLLWMELSSFTFLLGAEINSVRLQQAGEHPAQKQPSLASRERRAA